MRTTSRQLVMKEREQREQIEKALHDLIEIIHFTENVSTKIHGLLDEAEIYRTVKEEFAKTKRYNATIFLLTDDRSRLRIVETSLPLARLKAAQRASRVWVKEDTIDLNKSSICSRVIREGRTVHVRVSDIVGELLPRWLADLITRIIGYEKRSTILTPLKRHGKIVGVLGVSSTELAEQFIPSVRNLAQHISIALELAYEQIERKRAEERLRESEEKYRNLFENARDVIATFDLEGNVTSVNKAVMEHGLKKDEILGKNMLKFVSKRYWPRLLRELAEITRGNAIRGEIEIVTPKGKRVVDYRSTLIRPGKKVVGFQTILRDITERKKIEEELARERDLFQALMDNIPDAIYFKDVDSRFLRINRAHARRIGLRDPEEAVGKTVSDFYPEEYARKAYEDEEKILKTGQPLINKVEKIWTKDGKIRWTSITKVPLRDKTGRIAGIVGISRDVTERKRMEEELRRYSEHLEELVEDRTRELREAQDRLLKAERLAAIGETAAMVGHDLRNPLQAITNAVYMLKESAEAMDSKLNHYEKTVDFLPKRILEQICQEFKKLVQECGEITRIIEESVKYANKIVSDLQDYTRPVRPELAPTNLRQLIDKTLLTIRIPETIGVSIEIPEDFPKLMVDPSLMKRVLTNLITNALQAMSRGGRLTIRGEKKEENAFISIHDTGVGIPEENMAKLFHPLFTTKSKGQGFGLAVCKRLVEAHGGSIIVESHVGKGSTFIVKIPLMATRGG